MTEQIRLGVVGFGGRGRGMFQRAVEDFEGIVAAAICDNDPERLALAKEPHPEAARFADLDEMLDAGVIDALLVETPATCHAEFCGHALAKNVHVMSDIPPIATVEEGRRLWEIGEQSRALFMTGANPNMNAWIDTVIDLRARGLLGDPYYIECEYIHDCRALWPGTPWRETYEAIKYCTHDLGPVLRIIDEDIVSVSCFDTGSHINKQPGQHDAMAALFRTESNVVIRFLATFTNNRPAASHQVRIYATKGYFEATPPYLGKEVPRFVFYSTEIPGLEGVMPMDIASVRAEFTRYSKVGHGGTDHALLGSFFNAIRTGQPSPISLREGLRMSLPGIYAAESALRSGELVDVEYPWAGSGSRLFRRLRCEKGAAPRQ